MTKEATADTTDPPERLLPELWPLHRIAKELGKATHVLVSASREGRFPPVIQIGAVWHVRADLMTEWVYRQHATSTVTPEQRDRIREAGRSAEGAPPSRRRRQPRARTASSS